MNEVLFFLTFKNQSMKISTEFYNGGVIFFTIGVYFLLMNALGFADVFYLRLFNVLFVFYGANRTIQMNLAAEKKNFVFNAVSVMMTSLIGIFLSILGLIIYSYIKGGDAYVQSLSETFLFGGNPSIITYSISLLFEGIASCVIVTLLVMLYWNNRFKTD